MNWSIFGILSALSFGIQGTIAYELLDVQGFGSAAVNTIIHCIFAIFGLAFIYLTKNYDIIISITNILNNYKGLIILAGICALLGNVLLYWAYQLGTDINPGIITTISNGAVIISTLLAYFIFKKSVSIKQIIGIGVMLIAFTMGALGNKLFGIKEGLESRSKRTQVKNNNTNRDNDNTDDETANKKTETQENSKENSQQKSTTSKDVENKSDSKSDSKSTTKKKESTSPFWIIVSILSAFAYAGLSFFQYIVTQKAPKMNMIALAIMVAVVEAIIGIIIYLITFIPSLSDIIEKGPFANYRRDFNKLLNIKYYLFTFFPALFDGAGLTTLLQSYKLAPNPGFSDTISDAYSVVQSILTWIIYGKSMDFTQIVSIIVSIVGIALIST